MPATADIYRYLQDSPTRVDAVIPKSPAWRPPTYASRRSWYRNSVTSPSFNLAGSNGTTLGTIGHLYPAVIASEARQSSLKGARSATLNSYAACDSHWIATKPAAPRNDEA